MATSITRAQVSITTTSSIIICNSIFTSNRLLVPSTTVTISSNEKKKQSCRVVRCALQPLNRIESRRSISIAFLLFHCLYTPKRAPLPLSFFKVFAFLIILDAIAGSPFDKYVKRKKLDPLEAYVPAVILSQSQFKDLEKTLEGDQPQYATCRSLLRSGPAASLRVNIRAVAQYASDDGKGKAAFSDVDQCLRALEDLDSLLLRASRNDQGASNESMKAKIGIALVALDRLLQTVPSAVLDKGKAIADAYMISDEDLEPKNLDPEMKQLESLL
ncbi:hypothetical protein BVC80_209g83 [Macleaya cordata]|uniref:DUF7880 domain-containing protein n=1 Tax=Macleaya cordata TaxID=56857 RepID=A0A200QCX8_MACCD|nr:hypothetical protein BVC80_209g83 [Macleaya cordata]